MIPLTEQKLIYYLYLHPIFSVKYQVLICIRNSQNAKSQRLTSWRYDLNFSKQTTLFDGVDAGTSQWHVSIGGLIDRVHEGMNKSLMESFI